MSLHYDMSPMSRNPVYEGRLILPFTGLIATPHTTISTAYILI